MKSEDNELAKEFAVWCLRKAVPNIEIDSLFLVFSAEKDLKERDYEILTFRNKENNLLYTLHNGRYKTQNIDGFTDIGDRDLQYCLSYYEIRSVKQLSNGAVFNTDDFVTNGQNIKIRITKFNVINKELRIFTDNDYSGWNLLKDLTKIKPILFTTLDNVDILEGDNYWFIYPQMTIGFVEKASGKMIGALATFSTEIAAKNYKTENEKKYSLKDVREAMSGKYFDMAYNSIVKNVVLINLIENGKL